MKKKISLIIPSYNDKKKLLKLLNSINNWNVYPDEIIVIDSSKKKLLIPKDLQNFIKKQNIRLSIIYKNNLYPGNARNIGINYSTNSMLAFLDTSTLPNSKWLQSGLEIMRKDNPEGVWGNTYYQADTYISKLIRASTVGTTPIKTFPGSILKKNIFNKCGLFIEYVRAGEDGDWRSRLELHKINMSNSKEPLMYDKFNSMSISFLLKKWFRNYTYSSKLPFLRAHKDIYYYIVSLILIFFAYNWNNVFASWDEESFFYIPNITKISASLILISYFITRGVLIPKKKGVNLNFLFPINFIFVFFVSALLDVVKVSAFFFSKFNTKKLNND